MGWSDTVQQVDRVRPGSPQISGTRLRVPLAACWGGGPRSEALLGSPQGWIMHRAEAGAVKHRELLKHAGLWAAHALTTPSTTKMGDGCCVRTLPPCCYSVAVGWARRSPIYEDLRAMPELTTV